MSFLNAYSLKKNLFEITGQKVILRPPQYSDWKAWADERKKINCICNHGNPCGLSMN